MMTICRSYVAPRNYSLIIYYKLLLHSLNTCTFFFCHPLLPWNFHWPSVVDVHIWIFPGTAQSLVVAVNTSSTLLLQRHVIFKFTFMQPITPRPLYNKFLQQFYLINSILLNSIFPTETSWIVYQGIMSNNYINKRSRNSCNWPVNEQRVRIHKMILNLLLYRLYIQALCIYSCCFMSFTGLWKRSISFVHSHALQVGYFTSMREGRHLAKITKQQQTLLWGMLVNLSFIIKPNYILKWKPINNLTVQYLKKKKKLFF